LNYTRLSQYLFLQQDATLIGAQKIPTVFVIQTVRIFSLCVFPKRPPPTRQPISKLFVNNYVSSGFPALSQ